MTTRPATDNPTVDKPSVNPLQQYLATCAERVTAAMDHYLPATGIMPARLHEAMRYSINAGGKRVRPALVYAAGEAVGLAAPLLDGPACAVELIHTYSLIHDDLPSMDDDDLRRGQLTCHKAYDEATAILAGDAMQALAFHVLSRDEADKLPPRARLKMVEMLARASGSRGMVGGQAMDLANENREISIAELEDMHIHKTGALIRASVQLGILGAEDLDPDRFRCLDQYAQCVGLAFQIRDDILDVEGDTGKLGKRAGADQERNKSTYPSLLGLSRARDMAGELYQQSVHHLKAFDHRADPLRQLAQYIILRDH